MMRFPSRLSLILCFASLGMLFGSVIVEVSGSTMAWPGGFEFVFSTLIFFVAYRLTRPHRVTHNSAIRHFLNRLSLCLGIAFGVYALFVFIVGPTIDRWILTADTVFTLLIVVSIPWIVFFLTLPKDRSGSVPTQNDTPT